MLALAPVCPSLGIASWSIFQAAASQAGTRSETGARTLALDGLRGVLALMVVISHYFGEVAHGIKAAQIGWIAVKMFFVLSGFLMARAILDHLHTPGFFKTFYARRLCRTLPVYLVLLLLVVVSATLFQGRTWMETDRIFPMWRYLTFTQSFEMIARGDFGLEWLTPTWTLTVEEQFYLLAPLVVLAVPRRHLLLALSAGVALSLAFQIVSFGGAAPAMSALVLLPGVAHSMLLGMIAAMLQISGTIDWSRYEGLLRVVPLAVLAVVVPLKAMDASNPAAFFLLGVPLVSIGAAVYLVSIMRNAPETRSLEAPVLRTLGRLSYGIYLLHMPVLGLLHGLLLDAKPDIATPIQVAVTVVAVAVTLVVALVVNRTIEQPMIAFGKRWTFAKA